jgi:hypothetical protein
MNLLECVTWLYFKNFFLSPGTVERLEHGSISIWLELGLAKIDMLENRGPMNHRRNYDFFLERYREIHKDDGVIVNAL